MTGPVIHVPAENPEPIRKQQNGKKMTPHGRIGSDEWMAYVRSCKKKRKARK